MTEIPVGFTIVTPGSMDPGMHFGLEVKGLIIFRRAVGVGARHSCHTGLIAPEKSRTSHHSTV